MGLKAGYKQTDIGIIPEDWEVKKLKELFTIKSGLAFSSTYFSDKGPILLTPGNFKVDGGLYFNERNTKRYEGPYASSMLFNQGDLLVVMTDLTPDCNLLGKPAFVHLHEPMLHNQRIGKIELNKSSVSAKFLYWFFLSDIYAARMKETATGSTVRHTSNESIYNSSLPLPPTKDEQEAIAEALGDADALIESLEQLIAKKRNLKRGAMHELLTERKRLPGFGGEWKPGLMSDYFDPVTTRNEELNNNVMTISAQQGFVRQEEFFKKRVASNVLSNYYLLERGQFAYNRSYSNGYPFGAVKLLSKFDKAVVTTLYICFRPKLGAAVCLPFFEQYFEAGLLNDGLASVANEGGRAHGLLNVTKADFFSRPVKVPDFDEQTAIAAVLSDMDAELAALETKLDKARRLKQGMMHNLLTGSIRLV